MTPQHVKLISRLANLDMSVGLNLMRVFPCSRLNTDLKPDMIEKDLADTNIFHRFGKVMYNKRRIDLIQRIEHDRLFRWQRT